MKIIDSLGNTHDSIRKAALYHGIARSNLTEKLQKNCVVNVNGITFSIENEEARERFVQQNDDILGSGLAKRLAQRYSQQELEALANGDGLMDRELARPEIVLTGKKHKYMVISDSHIGSKYSPEEWHLSAFKFAKESGCDGILHCGDVFDGLSNRPDHIYELKHIGYKAQLEAGIKIFSQTDLPIYVISGNHDFYYMKSAGADIVQDLCSKVPNMHYLGNNQADINVDDCTIRLFHGLDGNSYALSYRLQKLVESFTGGNKPHIVFCGHTHKYCHVFERNVQAVSVPTLQMQTKFMQGKKIAAHTGWLIAEFETCPTGLVNFGVNYKSFYE